MKELNVSSVNSKKSDKMTARTMINKNAGEVAFTQKDQQEKQVINARKSANLALAKKKAKKKAQMAKASKRKNKK